MPILESSAYARRSHCFLQRYPLWDIDIWQLLKLNLYVLSRERDISIWNGCRIVNQWFDTVVLRHPFYCQFVVDGMIIPSPIWEFDWPWLWFFCRRRILGCPSMRRTIPQANLWRDVTYPWQDCWQIWCRDLCGPVNMVPEWSSNESSSDSTGLLDGSFSRHVSREMPQEHLHPCGAGMFGNYAQSEKLSRAIKISWRLQCSFRWLFLFQSCDPKWYVWYVNHLLECDLSYDSWFWTNSRCFGLSIQRDRIGVFSSTPVSGDQVSTITGLPTMLA